MIQDHLNVPEFSSGRKPRKAYKFIAVLCLLFIITMFSACEDKYELADPIDLNRSLTYIRPTSAPVGSGVCCKYEKTPTTYPSTMRPRSIKIIPGMKLVFYGTPLRMKTTNTQQPITAQYEWIMPKLPENPVNCNFSYETPMYQEELNYTRQDYFFLEYLLATGTPSNCVPSDADPNRCLASEKLKEIARNISNNDSNGFNRRYNECFLIPTLNTLQVYTVKNAIPQGIFTPSVKIGNEVFEIKNRSALELRELFSKPMREEFENQNPNFKSHWLQAVFLPGTEYSIELKSYDWSAHYFNDDVQERDKVSGSLENNSWYDANSAISSSRGYVEVEVPVRISSEINSHWYPAYYSFYDLEQSLGLRITGFRRSRKFLGTFNFSKKNKTLYFDPGCADCQKVEKKFLSSGDEYFSVKFGKKGKSRNADASVVVPNDEITKRNLLLAPGDVIFVAKKRIEATDRPEVR